MNKVLGICFAKKKLGPCVEWFQNYKSRAAMVCICHIGTFQITDDPPPTPPQKETSKLQIVVHSSTYQFIYFSK